MKNICLIVGTRPEAIKMAPVYNALRLRPGLKVTLVSTGQHRELLYQTFAAFGLRPDIDLAVMSEGQTLSGLTAKILLGLESVFSQTRPDVVLAHGDTTTCYASALSSFYHATPFFHVEAGLRTYRLDSPFPEEFNRQSVAKLTAHHFAPTSREFENLIRDGIMRDAITITGTTVQDAVDEVRSRVALPNVLIPKRDKLVVVTLHRREKGLSQLVSILRAIRAAALTNTDTTFVFPVHPNPMVVQAANEIFSGCQNLFTVPPMAYANFIALLSQANLVLTDSGGVQEEASYLGRRIMVLRDVTERDDGISQGLVTLVGVNPNRIEIEINRELNSPAATSATTVCRKTRASDIVAETVLQRCA